MGLANESGYPHKGTIDFADNRIDPTTGTISIRGVFPNPRPYELAPGLFVRIRVPIGVQAGALLVPNRALSTDQQGEYLLIVGPDHVVEHRAVEVGTIEDDNFAVIERGLKRGEQFIVEGLQFARPGNKVSPVSQRSEKRGKEPTKPAGQTQGRPATTFRSTKRMAAIPGLGGSSKTTSEHE